MRCRVTKSYSIDLPPGVKKEIEEEDTVTTYWFEGEQFFLQLSSYSQTSGQVMSAAQRIRNYLNDQETLEPVSVTLPVNAPDFAAVIHTDDKGQKWLISFLVWPDLTIFATILSHAGARPVMNSWASQAIETIERVLEN